MQVTLSVEVVNCISGVINPGELVAVMGPSGTCIVSAILSNVPESSAILFERSRNNDQAAAKHRCSTFLVRPCTFPRLKVFVLGAQVHV